MTLDRTLNDAQIAGLAEHLRGTCDSLGGALEQHFDLNIEDLTIADCRVLDGIVFCCECCDWWDTLDQMGEEGSCIECS